MQFLKFGGGRRFYAKDFRNAYHFRPDVAPPRQKFQGYINFVPNRALLGTFLGIEDSLNLRTRLSSLIRTAQLPEVTINTEVKNVYNKKRVITTGREYAPINLTLFDTIQNEWLTVLMKYFTYHFRDATNKMDPSGRDLKSEINNDSLLAYNTASIHATDSTTKGFDSDAFGFSPSYHKNFFERIDIIVYHGNKGVQYSLVNPTITTINFGDIDYSDSGFKDFNLSLAYEYFTVADQLNFELGEADLSRFERVDGVDLPGSRNAKEPVALKRTDISKLMERPRASQVFTQFSEEDVDVSKQSSNISATYNGYVGAGDSGPKSWLEGVQDFFEESPFGRILDRGLSAAVNGGDVKDALIGGLTNEVVAGISSPSDDTIFGPLKTTTDPKGWRPDSGTDNVLGNNNTFTTPPPTPEGDT